MRLGTCLAIEIVVGLSGLAGLSLGTASAVDGLRGYVAATDRAHAHATYAHELALPVPPAAPIPPPAPPPPAPAPAVEPTPAPAGPVWEFVGVADEGLLAPLRTGHVTRVKFNRGGSSLSLRLDFDNGARAAFKPEQVHLQTRPRLEIAAYRLDRLLGIGRVPPAIGGEFTVAELTAAVDRSQRGEAFRIRAETTASHGKLRGELSWWIPVISDVFINGARLDETDAIVTWRRWLRAGATIPPERAALASQLSTMILFDFLTDNTDRWSGNNAKTSEDGSVLYIMDNTLAFTSDPRGTYRSRHYLERVQVFSRGLVERLRTVEDDQIRTVLTADAAPYDRLLSPAELDALLGRRREALAYVDKLIAKYGADKVLAFP